MHAIPCSGPRAQLEYSRVEQAEGTYAILLGRQGDNIMGTGVFRYCSCCVAVEVSCMGLVLCWVHEHVNAGWRSGWLFLLCWCDGRLSVCGLGVSVYLGLVPGTPRFPVEPRFPPGPCCPIPSPIPPIPIPSPPMPIPPIPPIPIPILLFVLFPVPHSCLAPFQHCLIAMAIVPRIAT